MADDGTGSMQSRVSDAIAAPAAGAAATELVLFGAYALQPGLRRLERDGVTVHVGDRALDILCILVEHAGEVVSGRELMSRVWGKQVVGEGSLRFHINALRKVLTDGDNGMQYVRNVTRRGYTFVAPITRTITPAGCQSAQGHEVGKLPRRPTAVVGRDEDLHDVACLLSVCRFVSLVGTGGVGKTTVALDLAHGLREQFDLVFFVDLEAIKEPGWVTRAVAAAAGLVVNSTSPVSNLIAYFGARRVLLVLDCCERLLDAAAVLSEQLLQACAGVSILATSQEALRADGEHIYQLAPLRAPAELMPLSVESALSYSAIELFMARARAALPHFQLTPDNAADIAAICRSVDGIPLAIELAAGRVGTLALPTIAKLLTTQFALAWPGKRTAAERHRTLGGAIAWAIDLLSEQERVVLRRLAVFSAPFTLEAARTVACSDDIPAASVAAALDSLAARSLLSFSSIDASTHFSLLGVTRLVAGRMLDDSQERTCVTEKFANFLCEFLENAYAGSTPAVRGAVWHAEAACLGNLRTALDWVLKSNNASLIVRITAAAGPFFLDLSLLSDCAHWAQIGLDSLNESLDGSAYELELQASLGLALSFVRGSLGQANACLKRALKLAEDQRDPYIQMRLLAALTLFHERHADLSEAMRGSGPVMAVRRLA